MMKRVENRTIRGPSVGDVFRIKESNSIWDSSGDTTIKIVDIYPHQSSYPAIVDGRDRIRYIYVEGQFKNSSCHFTISRRRFQQDLHKLERI